MSKHRTTDFHTEGLPRRVPEQRLYRIPGVWGRGTTWLSPVGDLGRFVFIC